MPGFRVEDWDDAYANAPNIPNGDQWPEAWVKPAADFRDKWAARSELDVPYGPHPRTAFDLFLPQQTAKGLVVFVHGGFWIRLDKSFWSHLARGALESGWAVVIPSYPLCPEVKVSDIQVFIAEAISLAATKIRGPIRLSGHSAGGQIVTRLVSENSALPPDVLSRINHVLSISGVHDLRPLLKTKLNETIHLDIAEAQNQSPALLRPITDAPVTCWVGSNERSEFIRQNSLLANIWRGLGLYTEAVQEPDRHHFNVIGGLASPTSAITRKLLEN